MYRAGGGHTFFYKKCKKPPSYTFCTPFGVKMYRGKQNVPEEYLHAIHFLKKKNVRKGL